MNEQTADSDTDKVLQKRREKIIHDLMLFYGMSRQDAAFAANIELGIIPGDVLLIDDADEQE